MLSVYLQLIDTPEEKSEFGTSVLYEKVLDYIPLDIVNELCNKSFK